MKILLLIGLFVYAQNIRSRENSGTNEEWVSFIEEMAKKYSFNGSIVVSIGEGRIIQRNFGFTTYDSTDLINDNHRFNVGSIAKNICSEALVQLVDEGQVDYSDHISKFISELPPWKNNLTIGALLKYHGGLPSRNLRLDCTDEIFWRELQELGSLDDTKFQYSNYCNFIQAKIIEEITRGPLSEYVRTKIFDIYGMKNSVYEKMPPLSDSLLVRGFSNAYGDDINNSPFVLKFDLRFAPIYMTPKDLVLWITKMVNNYSSASEKVKEMYHVNEKIGPFGNFLIEGGQIEKYETAGQAYGFLVTGSYIRKSSITLVLASNYRDSMVFKIRDSILNRFDE